MSEGDLDPASERAAPVGSATGASRESGTVAGGSIPGLSRPAFSLRSAGNAALPVLVAVPHAGRAYPPDVIACLRHGEEAMHRLEDRHVDTVGRRVAALCGASLLIAHAPRAMIDLNRDQEDIDPGMVVGRSRRASLPNGRALRGLGLFPRRLPGLGELWRRPLRTHEVEQRVAAVHTPYHIMLSAELDRLHAVWGQALLIDLHSMPGIPTRGHGWGRTTHVLGDRFGSSCSRALSSAALEYFDERGIICTANRPYAGGYVLERHGHPRRGIHALQLEIDRSCYLDETMRLQSAGVEAQAELIAGLASVLAAEMAGNPHGMRQAAE